MLSKWVLKLPWDVVSLIAEKHGLEPELVGAIILVESGGNKYALRYEKQWKYLVAPEKYAKNLNISQETEVQTQMFSYGLCQVMLSVARELGYNDPAGALFDVATNVEFGCKHLSNFLLKYKGHFEDAIASYNAGSPKKDASGKYINQAYVDKVMEFYRGFGGSWQSK